MTIALSHFVANTATGHANWAIKQNGRRNMTVKRSEPGSEPAGKNPSREAHTGGQLSIFNVCSKGEQRRADSNRSMKVHSFGVTPGQEEAFKKEFVKAIVSSCISFNFVENEHHGNAFAKPCMKPLTRKKVSGKMLDELDPDNIATLQESIQTTDYPAGSSDGWQKKSCMSGAGLMNFTVMGNSGA
jgi:hypothetical protein